jgi:hypothetical protein
MGEPDLAERLLKQYAEHCHGSAAPSRDGICERCALNAIRDGMNYVRRGIEEAFRAIEVHLAAKDELHGHPVTRQVSESMPYVRQAADFARARLIARAAAERAMR